MAHTTNCEICGLPSLHHTSEQDDRCERIACEREAALEAETCETTGCNMEAEDEDHVGIYAGLCRYCAKDAFEADKADEAYSLAKEGW